MHEHGECAVEAKHALQNAPAKQFWAQLAPTADAALLVITDISP
jgi:hypothetical protein